MPYKKKLRSGFINDLIGDVTSPKGAIFPAKKHGFAEDIRVYKKRKKEQKRIPDVFDGSRIMLGLFNQKKVKDIYIVGKKKKQKTPLLQFKIPEIVPEGKHPERKGFRQLFVAGRPTKHFYASIGLYPRIKPKKGKLVLDYEHLATKPFKDFVKGAISESFAGRQKKRIRKAVFKYLERPRAIPIEGKKKEGKPRLRKWTFPNMED